MKSEVSFEWLCEQLMGRIGNSRQAAGELIRSGMISGELSAFAPRLNYYPQNLSEFHLQAEYGAKTDYTLPAQLWETLSVEWEESKLFFHFYDVYGVYLVPNICIDASQSYRFIKSRDPVLLLSLQGATETPAISNITKGPGGAPPKIDWERCLIEAARWMYSSKAPDTQADLISYIAEWLGSNAPSETQLKTHLGPLWRAFHEVDNER